MAYIGITERIRDASSLRCPRGSQLMIWVYEDLNLAIALKIFFQIYSGFFFSDIEIFLTFLGFFFFGFWVFGIFSKISQIISDFSGIFSGFWDFFRWCKKIFWVANPIVRFSWRQICSNLKHKEATNREKFQFQIPFRTTISLFQL